MQNDQRLKSCLLQYANEGWLKKENSEVISFTKKENDNGYQEKKSS